MFCWSLFVLLYFFFWPLCCLFFFAIRIMFTFLVSFGHCVVCSSSLNGLWLPLWYLLAIVLSVLVRYTDYDYLFGIFWPLCCLFFFAIRILITSLWYLQTLLDIILLNLFILIDLTCTFAVIWFILFMLLMYLYGEGLVICKNLFTIQLYK
jgi:hypothetical protein